MRHIVNECKSISKGRSLHRKSVLIRDAYDLTCDVSFLHTYCNQRILDGNFTKKYDI